MADVIAALMALYDGPVAHRLYDEVVTEREHALQCAAHASSAGAAPALVAAALLHDIGHLVLDDNVALDEDLTVDHQHDAVGARHLARWFPPSVTAPIALHVEAKRFLCATEPEYFDALSPSSRRSLDVQGGPMTEGEVESFERRPGSSDAIAVRRWDDLGKVDGVVVPGFEHYVELLRGLTDLADRSDA